MNSTEHIPVLKFAVMQSLQLNPAAIVVDATYGRGGHARAIVEKLDSGRLLVIDRDADAITHAQQHMGELPQVEIVQARFSHLAEILRSRNLYGKVNGLLFDLGVSSPQLTDPARGFSFTHPGPLDMRMDNSANITAADYLKQISLRDLTDILRRFGEERFAGRIARAIKNHMAKSPITTTKQLADLVVAVVPTYESGKHPATRTFQAIRIAINDELTELESVLPQAVAALAAGGRLVIISFHSLEDRIVKRFLRDQARGDPWPTELAVHENMKNPQVKLIGKPIRAGEDEVAVNRRARSAIMRVAEKLPGKKLTYKKSPYEELAATQNLPSTYH